MRELARRTGESPAVTSAVLTLLALDASEAIIRLGESANKDPSLMNLVHGATEAYLKERGAAK